jgi:hypothetical protein
MHPRPFLQLVILLAFAVFAPAAAASPKAPAVSQKLPILGSEINSQPAPDAPSVILGSTFFSWVEISAVGTRLNPGDWPGGDDEGHASVALPWPFPWFGSSYSTLYIDPNGNVGFENWPVETWIADNRIPSPAQPNNRIAVFYEDMAGPGTGACGGTEGGLYTHYDIANIRFILQFHRWCSWENFQVNTFEVILYPNGRVIVQYLSMPSAPARLPSGSPAGESPAGVEGPDGAAGYAWAGPVMDGSAWLFQPYDSAWTNILFLPLIE